MSVPKSKLSFASTSVNIVQMLGGPILTTGLAVVVSLCIPAGAAADPHSFRIPFLALIVVQLLVLGSAVRLPWRIHLDGG
jgi:hypothetical protein